MSWDATDGTDARRMLPCDWAERHAHDAAPDWASDECRGRGPVQRSEATRAGGPRGRGPCSANEARVRARRGETEVAVPQVGGVGFGQMGWGVAPGCGLG